LPGSHTGASARKITRLESFCQMKGEIGRRSQQRGAMT
jgi:hypothetical protein